MKKHHAWGVYILAGLIGAVPLTHGAAVTERQIVERGPHHRTVNYVSESIAPEGGAILRTNRYTELATGICYQNQAGEWLDSRELIEIVAGGALASQGPHHVAFAANVNTAGAINILTPDGKRLRSHVLGLAYTDAQTGQSVLIAQIRDSIGVLVGENRIVYADAFTELIADIRYTYSLAGVEQDIILRQVPPAPGAFGLNPATTRLEVFTEFVEAPTPEIYQGILSATTDPVQRATMALPDFVDESLGFGAMAMTRGQAFPLADQTEEIPTGKTWELREGRRFLVEAVQYPAIKVHLDALAGNPGQQAKLERKPQPNRSFPAAPKQASAEKAEIKTALLNDKRPGFVIDWSLMASDTNFTFKGDSTYFMTGLINLSGTTVFEGGTVLKYTNNASSNPRLVLKGPVDFRTQPYLPAIFTAKDDDTVGEIVSGSSGTPLGFYAQFALAPESTTNSFNISNIVVRYAREGVSGRPATLFTVWNGQFYRCSTAVSSQQANSFRNCLLSLCTNGIVGVGTFTNFGEHITFARCDRVAPSTVGATYLTNCLIVAATNLIFAGGANNYSNSVFGDVFQTVGTGDHYLKDSTYRDLGTTNINSTLLASLRKKTTYAPVWLSNAVATDLLLAPAALRDTGTPDIGYHYDPLDYYVSGLDLTNVTVVITNGAAIAADYSATNWGFILRNSKLVSIGNPTNMNRLVRAHMVQERSSANPSSRALFQDGYSATTSNELRARFTFFSQLASDGNMLDKGTNCRALEWSHSALYNPMLIVRTDGTNTLTCGLTNNVWERGTNRFGITTSSANSAVHVRNNLFKNSIQDFVGGNSGWTANDNLVDGGGLHDYGTAITNICNAYYQAVTNLSGGTSNLTLGSLTYVVGPLSIYYQPTNSPLINTGSMSAASVALFHFTSTTNQVKETNSLVDIGPHWIALNASGSPVDTDSDGLPDFYEDWSGNGSVNSGETDWQNASDFGLRVFITRPRNSVIP